MADQLSDLSIDAAELFCVPGKIHAPSRGLGNCFQLEIGIRESFLDEGTILAFLRGEFFSLLWLSEVAGKRDGKNADVGSQEFLLSRRPVFRPGGVHAGGEQDRKS